MAQINFGACADDFYGFDEHGDDEYLGLDGLVSDDEETDVPYEHDEQEPQEFWLEEDGLVDGDDFTADHSKAIYENDDVDVAEIDHTYLHEYEEDRDDEYWVARDDEYWVEYEDDRDDEPDELITEGDKEFWLKWMDEADKKEFADNVDDESWADVVDEERREKKRRKRY